MEPNDPDYCGPCWGPCSCGPSCMICAQEKEEKQGMAPGTYTLTTVTMENMDGDEYTKNYLAQQAKEKAMTATLSKARTQKAKGVIALIAARLNVPHLDGICQTKEDVALFNAWPKFGRPCPLKPRHGFVDSKIIKSQAELEKMLADTLAADPSGEVMIMAPITNARFNAIWTPTLLTIGEGNAGATEGINTISLPLSGKMDDRISKLLVPAGISKKDDPYVEIVQGVKGGYGSFDFLTQLRCGPKLGKATENYIPVDLVVSEVIKVSGQSLLEWEKLIQSKSKSKGLVIYHPGGSLTDHYTVHARTYSIPVILKGDCPAVGACLKKESDALPFSASAILKGAVCGEQVKIPDDDRSTFVSGLLVALYNSLSMTGEAGFWLGAATSMMIRFGVAALKGEARHVHTSNGWGATTKPGSIHYLNREQIYNKWIPFSLSRHRAAVCRIISIHRYGDFGGSSSVGGENWAKCGVALLPLINDLGLLAREPSEEGVKRLIRSLNIAVDQAHNNGWWLNKFAYGTSFEAVQTGRITEITKAIPAFWAISEASKQLSDQLYQKRVGRWAEWKPLNYEAPVLSQAELSSFPGVPGMIFDVRSRLLGKYMRKVIIDPLTVTAPPKGNLYIIPNDTGGFSLAAMKGSEISTLWSEEPLAPKVVKILSEKTAKKEAE